jgi:hypothetical protein
MKLYHGSPTPGIKSFNLDPKNRRFNDLLEGEGIYLTDSLEAAKDYAMGGVVYECTLSESPIFDATDEKEFQICFKVSQRKVGVKLQVSKNTAKYIDDMVHNYTMGKGAITKLHELMWQLFSNDERVATDEEVLELANKVTEKINEYVKNRPILKYRDPDHGYLVFVVRDPSLIQIQKETPVENL